MKHDETPELIPKNVCTPEISKAAHALFARHHYALGYSAESSLKDVSYIDHDKAYLWVSIPCNRTTRLVAVPLDVLLSKDGAKQIDWIIDRKRKGCQEQWKQSFSWIKDFYKNIRC